MEQYTKWTGIQITTDPEFTPITRTRISDIPVKEVRTTEGVMISYRDKSMLILNSGLVFPDGSTATVVEMEDRRWRIDSVSEDGNYFYSERHDGRWSKYNSAENRRLLEDYSPNGYHRFFIYMDENGPSVGDYDCMNKKYTFNVSDFTADKARGLSDVLKAISVNEDYESIYITGQKQDVVKAMDSLIESITKARQAILDTPES